MLVPGLAPVPAPQRGGPLQSLVWRMKFSFKITLWLHFIALSSYLLGMNNLLGNKVLNNLTISAINCNSLNSSIPSKSLRNLKVHGITKLGTDIIFLSDIRLSNKQMVSCKDEIVKQFQLNMYDGYDCHFNSSQNKRGVAVLVNKKVPFLVQDQFADPEENFLLLKVVI
jgi:hypothetical protein